MNEFAALLVFTAVLFGVMYIAAFLFDEDANDD